MNQDLNNFFNSFDEKLNTFPQLTQEQYSKEEERLSNMSEDQVRRELEDMFHLINKPYTRELFKIDRNDQCFCGSGKKYKNCCQKIILTCI